MASFAGVNDMRVHRLLGAFLLFCGLSGSQAAGRSPVLVGHFTNQKISSGSEPHILSGYSVSIYRSGNKLFGDVGIGIGSSEPARTVLYDIAFDDRTKKIAFKAKYSAGRQFGKDIPPQGRESRLVMSFLGVKTPTAIKGTVTEIDGDGAAKTAAPVRVVLKRTGDDFVPANYEEWTRQAGS